MKPGAGARLQCGEKMPADGTAVHAIDAAAFARVLLDWYDRAARDLPWRAPPGVSPDPYRVWLAEVMLQQTTVKTVEPYYAEFLRLWPSVQRLAAADLDDVLRAWAGLGYYSRARNLHRCAGAVVAFHGGEFPDEGEALRALPGIGAYTAAAIAAIAYDRPATVVDGNVERVIARLFAVRTPLPEAKPDLRERAAMLTPRDRPGDYAQAMMDLGATVCTPRRPACLLCPVAEFCAGKAEGIAEVLPYKAEAKEKPVRRGTAFFALRSDGSVLLRRRPERGLLGGMMEVPTGVWSEDMLLEGDPLDAAPLEGRWSKVSGVVRHTFTHFHLELAVYFAMVQAGAVIRDEAEPERCRWVPQRDLDSEALPSLMRKVVAHALNSWRGTSG
jgi:A/G-specific adenine glycosylase